MMVEVDFNLILGIMLGLFISLVSVYVYSVYQGAKQQGEAGGYSLFKGTLFHLIMIALLDYIKYYSIMLDPLKIILECKSFSRVINFAIYMAVKLFSGKKFLRIASRFIVLYLIRGYHEYKDTFTGSHERRGAIVSTRK